MIFQKVQEMSHACSSVFTISTVFVSSFFSRKMSSDLQDIVHHIVENLCNIQPELLSNTSPASTEFMNSAAILWS